MLNLAPAPGVAALVARLPATPPSAIFCLVANRVLWPALQDYDWQPLVGRRYAIRVKDLGAHLHFTLTPQGFSPKGGVADLTISANAADYLALMTRREDPDTLFFSRRLVSEGDTELGLVVKNLLDAIDFATLSARLPQPLAWLAQRVVGASFS